MRGSSSEHRGPANVSRAWSPASLRALRSIGPPMVLLTTSVAVPPSRCLLPPRLRALPTVSRRDLGS